MSDMDLNRIVVDTLTATIESQQWPYSKGCHLFHLDNVVDDLDIVAMSLGLKVAWRHDAPGFPHYDLSPRMRTTAVELGIREVTRDDPDFRDYLKQRSKRIAAAKGSA